MKGVFNIMKTNKITKLMIAFLAVLTVFSLTATAFAQTGTDTTGENTETQAEASAQTGSAPEKHGHKDGKTRSGHPKKYDDDRFEDWFEDRIDDRGHRVDFSQLGEDPTDEEIVEFFKNNFMGGRSGENGKHSGGHKDSSLPADQPNIEPAPGSEPAPESVEPAPAEQPAEESVKDKA